MSVDGKLSSSFGHESVLDEEFEWIEGEAAEHYQHILKEGYLSLCSSSEEQLMGDGLGLREGTGENGIGLVTPTSGSLRRVPGSLTFSRVWKKRWCVLSQTEENGTNLLYYKQQSTFDNSEPPSGVLLMEDCKMLYTIPSHPRSKNIFAADFSHETMLFNPESESELEEWLDAFQRSLKLRDETLRRERRSRPPLKGLPKQKAIRRDKLFTPQSSLEEVELTTSPLTHSKSSSPVPKEPPPVSKEVPQPPETDSEASAAKKVKVLSYKNLST